MKKDDASTIGARLRVIGFQRYSDYLASSHWQKLRASYKASDRPQRCACGAPATALHHLTYVRLGQERLDDIVAICDDCHREAHGKGKPRKRSKPGKRRKAKRGTRIDPSIIRPPREQIGYAQWVQQAHLPPFE